MYRVVFIGAVLCVSMRAHAFSCAVSPVGMGCGAAIKSHAAVFVGRRVSAEEVQLGPDAGKLAGWNWRTTMEVRERFGGDIGSEIIIFSYALPPPQPLPNGTLVGFGSDAVLSFSPDEDYLVFADEEHGRLYATNCGGAIPARYARETIEKLRHLPASGTATLSGRVAEFLPNPEMGGYSSRPLFGIAITASGPVQRILVSGSDGHFGFADLPPGDYEISAALPSLYAPLTPFKATLVDQACATVQFQAHINGRIAGRLLDPEGNPVAQKSVELERANSDPTKPWSNFHTMTSTGEDGNFHFDSLAPDRYLLGVNLQLPQGTDTIYPPTYYPGVTDRAGATVLELARGQQVEDLRLVLPHPIARIMVDQPVTVHWPNGRLADGVEVSVEDQRWPDYHFSELGWTTDKFGRSVLKLRSGESYEIFVYKNIDLGKQVCGGPVILSLDESRRTPTPLDFVLDHNSGNCNSKGVGSLRENATSRK